MPCSLEHELRLTGSGYSIIAGIDEAGRGPLAGSVFASAVVLPAGFIPQGINDSKKLTPRVRERLHQQLTSEPDVLWAVAKKTASEIDLLNILRATHAAMRTAWELLEPRPDHVLIDGLPVPQFPCPQTALVGGDAISLSIAAANHKRV